MFEETSLLKQKDYQSVCLRDTVERTKFSVERKRKEEHEEETERA